MSMKLDAGEVNRTELFYIDPKEIIVNETVNGRWQPHTEESVLEMAESFKAVGQMQEVLVRRLPDKKVQLGVGYRRWKGAMKYNELYPEMPMKLLCRVVEINDEEVFIRNIIENRERKVTTAMDDALNQNRFREKWGWNDTRIAEFYKVSSSYVCQLRKLLSLSFDIQKLIHSKELAVDAALGLAELPAEEQANIVKESKQVPDTVAAVNNPGEVTEAVEPEKKESLSSKVKKKVREAKAAKGGKQARSMKEVKSFFEGLTGPAEKPSVRELAELMLKLCQGYYTDKTLVAKINGLFPEETVTQEAVA